jgi:hypothetical protein
VTTGLRHMCEMAFARGEPRDQVQQKKASLVLRSCSQPVTAVGGMIRTLDGPAVHRVATR